MSIYGLIIGFCIVIGLEYFFKKNQVIPKNKEKIFLFFLIIISIVFARIYFVVFNWPFYSQNLSQIPNIRGGGISILGGLIGGIIFIYFFAKKNKIKFLKITNLIAPILPLCQSIGRFGNYFNHEIYSKTNQPIWLYESILDLILFFFLIKKKTNQTAYYLIGYGLIRFITEFFRYDVWIVHSLKIGQLIGIIFMATGIIIIRKNYSLSNHK
jgi:phosphatidylglycerol---prolipoprotein diacylglyceryl transferase